MNSFAVLIETHDLPLLNPIMGQAVPDNHLTITPRQYLMTNASWFLIIPLLCLNGSYSALYPFCWPVFAQVQVPISGGSPLMLQIYYEVK